MSAPTTELNIRLDAKGRSNTLRAIKVRQKLALQYLGRYGKVEYRRSTVDGVARLIVRVHAGFIQHDDLYRLAELLHQDCISVYYWATSEAALIGPNASAWGEFDIKAFEAFDPNSRRNMVLTPTENTPGGSLFNRR